jgi:hypothetical protein
MTRPIPRPKDAFARFGDFKATERLEPNLEDVIMSEYCGHCPPMSQNYRERCHTCPRLAHTTSRGTTMDVTDAAGEATERLFPDLEKTMNERCPSCRLNWRLFPPAQISGLPMVRCIECKCVYDENGEPTNG